MEEKPAYQMIWDNFSANTTGHGLSRLNSHQSRRKLIFWGSLFVGATSICLILQYSNIKEYYEYKTSIQTAESFTKRGEMDISFCLTITESEAEREKLGALKLLNDFYQSGLHCIFTILEDIQLHSDASRLTEFYSVFDGANMFEAIHSLSPDHPWYQITIEDILVDCFYSSPKMERCSADDFTEYWEPSLGRCYKFNNSHGNDFKGLELSLYIPASSDGNVGLYGGFTYEVTEEVKGAGAVIMVQDKDTKPNLLDGVSVTPGFSSYISVEENRYTRLPSPYPSNCTEQQTIPDWNYRYSRSGCQRTCEMQTFIELCGCASSAQTDSVKPPDSSVPYCHQNFCDYNNTSKYLNCVEKWIQPGCDHCRPACHETVFESKMLRQFMWPTERDQLGILSYLDEGSTLYKDLVYTYPDSGSKHTFDWKPGLNITKILATRYLMRNLANVKVFRSDQKATQIYTERPVVEKASLLSNIGGALGLCIGFSVITVAELIELLIVFCLSMAKARGRRQIGEQKLPQITMVQSTEKSAEYHQ